jgi:hypothetical protein
VKVTFAPVETSSLTATLMIGVPSGNAILTVPISGTASAQAASTSPFDFAVRNVSEASGQFLIVSEPLRTSMLPIYGQAVDRCRCKAWRYEACGCET